MIEVRIKSHPIWEVKGLDVYADLPISLDELDLGVNILFASPKGIYLYQYLLEVYLSEN